MRIFVIGAIGTGMTFAIIAIISGILIIVLAFMLIGLARSILSEVPDDTILAARRNRSIFARFWSWLNRSPPMLDYRRDKRGRFRKVRRG